MFTPSPWAAVWPLTSVCAHMGLQIVTCNLAHTVLSKPQLNHNSTQPNITLSWVRHENDFAHKNLKSNLRTKRSKKAAEPSKKYTPAKKITEFWASKPEGSRVQENKIDDKTLEPEAANTGCFPVKLEPLQTRLSGNSENLGLSEKLSGESFLSQPRGLELAAFDWTDGSRRDRLSQS